MPEIDKVLPAEWPSFAIENVREHPSLFATYSSFPLHNGASDVPADDEYAWLASQPVQQEWSISCVDNASDGLDVAGKIEMFLGDAPIKLPRSFASFIQRPELHRRIRSCTACYLELPNWLVETGGIERGYLVHFLSDQQWCLHWYLYVNDAGEERVLCSPWDYGFYEDGGGRPTQYLPDGLPDISSMELTICAQSFTEFIYRFWIENEIWFARQDKQPLTSDQERYVERLSGRSE